jgi:hypothetical protein
MFDAAENSDYSRNGGKFKADTSAFAVETAADHSSMDQLAKDTGGRAVYDSNGLKEALDRALSDGSDFYTLAYTPTNQEFNGATRKIEVKVVGGKYQLLYRRSYVADKPGDAPHPNPLSPNSAFMTAMRRGVPSSTQISYEVRAVPSGSLPPPGPIAGQNTGLKGPLARYAIDYAADPRALELSLLPNGYHKGEVIVVTAAYDRDGNVLNAVSTTQPIALAPDAYAKVHLNGIQLHQMIDLPVGEVYLRTGIYDSGSGNIGTLEIPLNVTTPESNATPMTK